MSGIYRFGESKRESGLKDKWYELNGEKHGCDEETINHLWWQWVVQPDNPPREDDENNVIFVSKHPLLAD